VSGVVGTFLEAWGEVRVHRARVVLSLVGVVLAVFAMTIITAAGAIGQQVVLESGERSSGRSTTLNVSAYGQDGSVDLASTAAALQGLVDRYGVEYSSTVLQMGVQTGPGQGEQYLDVWLVEPDYGVIHRLDPVEGRWLSEQDLDRLAPAAVVNRTLLERAGMADRAPPFAFPLGTTGSSITVVGVVDRNPHSGQVYVLAGAGDRLGSLVQPGAVPGLELWVPPDLADQIIAEVPAVLAAQGLQGQASATSDPGLPGLISKGRWAVRALSLFALALGAVGVLNVGIVTVRQRVREIGVRRALGSSSGRVFAAIVLESVCATALAGLVGVAAAVALMVNLPLETLLRDADITDVPAFPFSAALEAFLAAVAVGALAGLVPATIAVRSKVIDAIRY
jgi:putative ABC transport system permease protein